MANKIVHDAKNKEFYAMLNDKKGFVLILCNTLYAFPVSFYLDWITSDD